MCFYKILEQSSILYSILQSRETDFSYGTSRIERFKNFVSSLRTDECFSNSYQETVDTVGEPLSRIDRTHNYKQVYFEIIDSIVGVLTERFQDMKQFEFLDLVNPKVESQLSFIYNDKDFHKESSNQILKYMFKFNLQSSLPEAVKLFKMTGVLAVASASVER